MFSHQHVRLWWTKCSLPQEQSFKLKLFSSYLLGPTLMLWFPQFFLSFPGSSAPYSRTLSTPTTRGNWFQRNQPEYESDDHASPCEIVTSVCVTNEKNLSSKMCDKFDHHHLSLYYGAVKPRLQTGPEYWFLWGSSETWFPKFTKISKMYLKVVTILTPMKKRWEKL